MKAFAALLFCLAFFGLLSAQSVNDSPFALRQDAIGESLDDFHSHNSDNRALQCFGDSPNTMCGTPHNSGSIAGAPGTVIYKFKDGLLASIIGSFESEDYSQVHDAVIGKYGPPTSVVKKEYTNGLGAKVDRRSPHMEPPIVHHLFAAGR